MTSTMRVVQYITLIILFLTAHVCDPVDGGRSGGPGARSREAVPCGNIETSSQRGGDCGCL